MVKKKLQNFKINLFFTVVKQTKVTNNALNLNILITVVVDYLEIRVFIQDIFVDVTQDELLAGALQNSHGDYCNVRMGRFLVRIWADNRVDLLDNVMRW